jgi:transposase
VERGLRRRNMETVRFVGIDEKSFGRGQDYVSLMTDLEQSRVLDVVADRTAEACQELWTRLGAEQSHKVEAVTIDMWQPYLSTTTQAAPQAQIVHDKFHVAKHLNEAVDQVRRAENRQLHSQGSDLLSGTKYVWLKNPDNWHEADQLKFDALRSCGCKVARAWQLKELFREFWSCFNSTEAESFFNRWYSWAIRCRLTPIKDVARMLRAHLENLLTYFTYSISNALTEGFNSKIQSLKHAARGFRTFANFRIRILFFCGRLNLYPPSIKLSEERNWKSESRLAYVLVRMIVGSLNSKFVCEVLLGFSKIKLVNQEKFPAAALFKLTDQKRVQGTRPWI